MPTVDLDGLRVHYQQLGQGPDLVMLHGLLSSLAFWYLTVLPLLARDFRVTVYDLRGHGRSGMPQRGYTTHELAGDLGRLLDALDIDRAHLVGHSFGGAVALHYAALNPERVVTLVEADGQIPRFQSQPVAGSSDRWRRTRARLTELGYEAPERVPRVARGFLEDIAFGGDGEQPPPAELAWRPDSPASRRWHELMRTTSASRELGQTAGLTLRRIRGVAHPTLAIFGERSYCMPTLRALERNLGSCTRQIVPGAGHLFPARNPELLAGAVRRFTKEAAA
jgi:pimeloyl-ACP methyl ester carboxylesterase